MSFVKRHISGLSDEEYLKLARQLVDEQYDTLDEEEDLSAYDFFSDPFIDSYQESKPKQRVPDLTSGRIDLSRATLDEISKKIHMTGNVTVGPFIVRIKRYDASGKDITLDIDIMEERKKIFPGNKPGKITEKINMVLDSRFYNKTWSKYFANPIKNGSKVPLQTAAEIIKYLQFVYQNPAFL